MASQQHEADDNEVEDRGQTVDRAKYLELNRKYKKLMERNSELEDQVLKLEPKAATVDQLTEKLRTQESTFKAEKATWEQDGILRDAGINDDAGRVVARALYNQLPEKERPPLPDWLATMKKEPGKAPRPLQSYFEPPKQGGQSHGQQGQQSGTRPDPTAGVVGGVPGGTAGTPTQAEIMAARASALAGDRSAWDALQRRMGFAPMPKATS